MGTNDTTRSEPISIKESAQRFGVQYVPAAIVDPLEYLPRPHHYACRDTCPQTNGCTPLLGLIARGCDFSTVQQHIIAKPEQVHQTSDQGWTPLHMVCVCAASDNGYAKSDKHTDIMCALIEAGANINACDADGFTPLMRLLSCGALPVTLFNILMDRHCDVSLRNGQGNTALHLFYGWSESLNQQIIRPIFDAGFNVNSLTSTGDNLLMIMIRAHRDRVNEALARMVFISSETVTQNISMLLDRGIEIDTVDPDGNTCLHIAAGNNLSSIARVLINRGADVNARNNDGDTPIMLCHWSESTTIKALRDAGATDRAPKCRCCSLI